MVAKRQVRHNPDTGSPTVFNDPGPITFENKPTTSPTRLVPVHETLGIKPRVERVRDIHTETRDRLEEIGQDLTDGTRPENKG